MRAPTSLTWPQQVVCRFLISKPVKPNPNRSPFKIRPFFQIPTTFSLKSVDFWHNKHRIWLNQWFLITICQKSRQIRWDLTGSWMDLARSRRVSKHSGDNQVHQKPTTTRRQPELMNPLLLRVGCRLKNHPPDLVRVDCGLGKNPTCPTHGQP